MKEPYYQQAHTMSNNPGFTERVEAIREQSPTEAADALAKLEPDEIQFVLTRLPHDQAMEVASHMAESVGPEDLATRAVLSGVEETIGELMTPVPAVLPASHTVAESLAFLVKSSDLQEISYIFVTEAERLVGVVGMRELLLAKPSETLADIMIANPFAFQADTPIHEAIGEVLYRHYPLYPVVDDAQRILGVVHGWKLYERIASELSGQAGAQYGVDKEEQVSTSVLSSFRMRHPWLLVNLATAFAAAVVVGAFEDTITRIVALAVFLPVLAGQSGNTGAQALAITLRGMTLGQLRDYPVGKLLRKEILLGALNGVIVGLIAGVVMFIYAVMTNSIEPLLLGLVIVIAMTGACIGSGIFGVMVPLTLKRFGADPATASSIFLTTFTDILGMGLMLFLATALVL
ncbi:magnesium transporter [Thiohalospira halophila DSM 15071]|uniref:Magnesium transporter n=1 Tax=Thiohalospira halophila DSM 15071 TaxID=1123397 RepID=A0A1I1PXE9_9GAMM|nr:magnesium transporter [Thiohalospira halophila]SFD14576.1 magnesium transporter [Thiohalospira halophila DSM 15071]